MFLCCTLTRRPRPGSRKPPQKPASQTLHSNPNRHMRHQRITAIVLSTRGPPWITAIFAPDWSPRTCSTRCSIVRRTIHITRRDKTFKSLLKLAIAGTEKWSTTTCCWVKWSSRRTAKVPRRARRPKSMPKMCRSFRGGCSWMFRII